MVRSSSNLLHECSVSDWQSSNNQGFVLRSRTQFAHRVGLGIPEGAEVPFVG